MDAKKFLSERKRMCDSYGSCCNGCPVSNLNNCLTIHLTNNEMDELIEAVEKWSKHHPGITNRDKFREVFGSDIGINVITMRSNPVVSITDDWLNKEYKAP